jgi:hypothetical protein
VQGLPSDALYRQDHGGREEGLMVDLGGKNISSKEAQRRHLAAQKPLSLAKKDPHRPARNWDDCSECLKLLRRSRTTVDGESV